LILQFIFALVVNNLCSLTKNFFNQIFFIAFLVLTTSQLSALLFIFTLLFFFTLFFIKNINTHTVFVLLYGIFYLFFVNISVYNQHTTNSYIINCNISNTTSSYIFGNYYETFFFLKKHSVFVGIKNDLVHVSGFSIISNAITNLFIFSKNSNIHAVFVLEIVFILIYYILIFCANSTSSYNTNNLIFRSSY
jgi:hypothetical protein